MSDHKEHVTDKELDQIPDFEQMMLQRINRDVSESIEFTRRIRREYLDNFQMYNRGTKQVELRKDEIYPTDFYSQVVNTFVSSMMKPLWAKDEPCTLTPGPNTSAEEVEAKQELHDYQNREDGLKETHRIAIQDIALYGLGIVKTDYTEIKETVWGTEDIPINQTFQEIDPVTQEVVGEFEQPVLDPETGEQATRTISVPKESFIYKGPHSERIDPQNFFFNVDKRRGDSNPIMVRSFVEKAFFDTQSFFFNQDKLEDLASKEPEKYDNDAEEIRMKRNILNMQDDGSRSRKELVYFEWQGLVDKKKLFTYLGPKFETDQRTGEEVDVHSTDIVADGEQIMCVGGVVNGEVVVRLDKFFLDHGNIVVGIMAPIDNELVGDSIGRQAKPGGKMLDILAGVMFKSLRMAVNRGHIINIRAITGGVPDVNQDGFVLKTTVPPGEAHAILDQPSVAADVYQAMALVQQWTRDRIAVQENTTGRADPNAETLGENIIIQQESSVRSDDPLEMIEDTFVIPIARIRDEVNMTFLTDPKYLIEVIGEDKLKSWKPLTPDQVRAHTRFMCESSGRESEKAVITQQLLQANQIAPNIQAAGQAIRLDRMMFRLLVDGFGMTPEEAEYFLPGVKMENQTGSGEQMDQLMAQTQQATEMNKLLAAQVQAIQLQIAAQFPLGLPGQGGENGNGPQGSTKGPGEELPQPTNEGDAAQSLIQSGMQQVGV